MIIHIFFLSTSTTCCNPAKPSSCRIHPPPCHRERVQYQVRSPVRYPISLLDSISLRRELNLSLVITGDIYGGVLIKDFTDLCRPESHVFDLLCIVFLTVEIV